MLSTVIAGSSPLVMTKLCCLALSSFRRHADIPNIRQPVTSAPEARLAEVRPDELRPAEVRAAEVRPAEVRPAEVHPDEVRPAEVRPANVRPAEVQRDGVLFTPGVPGSHPTILQQSDIVVVRHASSSTRRPTARYRVVRLVVPRRATAAGSADRSSRGSDRVTG